MKKIFLLFLIISVSSVACMSTEIHKYENVQVGYEFSYNITSEVIDFLDTIIIEAKNLISTEHDEIILQRFNHIIKKMEDSKESLEKDKTCLQVFFELQNVVKLNTEFVKIVSAMNNLQELPQEHLEKYLKHNDHLATLEVYVRPHKSIIWKQKETVQQIIASLGALS